MTKSKFVFNIDGKEVVKGPKEALKILKKDYEDLKLNVIELSVTDVVTMSLSWKDNDAGDIEDWGLPGWEE